MKGVSSNIWVEYGHKTGFMPKLVSLQVNSMELELKIGTHFCKRENILNVFWVIGAKIGEETQDEENG